MRPKDTDLVVVQGIEFSFKEVNTIVDLFYKKIATDSIMSKPFKSVSDWPEHIDRLTNFWWIRFGGKPFTFSQYNPVAKHYHSGFNKDFLDRWLFLFDETLKENLSKEQHEFWIEVARKTGKFLSKRNEAYAKEFESKK